MGQIRVWTSLSGGEEISIADTIASDITLRRYCHAIRYCCHVEELWAAVDLLPEVQRESDCAPDLEQQTYQEAGESLGISASAVRYLEDKAMRT